jgi:hypothetical protein
LKDVSEQVSALQRDLDQLEKEFGLRDEVARLRNDLTATRKELEAAKSAPPRAWYAEVAPWTALVIIGFAFAVAWYITNSDRERARKKEVNAERIKLALNLLHNAVKDATTPVPPGELKQLAESLTTLIESASLEP